MAIFELKAEVPTGVGPALENLLAEREEQRLLLLEDKPADRAWLTGYFKSRAEAMSVWMNFIATMADDWAKIEPRVRELPDEDWKDSYKAHFKAWKFGRLHWVPVWERESFVLPAGEAVLWLDPGMAFGTGNHETTRLCCERLVAFAASDQRQVASDRRPRPKNECRVIDAGCGSGILALSAAKLGFRQVTAFDSEPLAVGVSKKNAEFNGLGGRVDFHVGDLVSGLAGRQAELVLANIQADVLMKFAPELLAAVAPEGVLVLSGILASELEQVQTAFGRLTQGWTVDSRVMGEWSDLVLTRS